MCGIFGATEKVDFLDLLEMNLVRGSDSYGVYAFAKGRSFLYKGASKPTGIPDDMDYYLGHVRAPTTSVRHFRYDISHPFQHHNIMVGHNGIIRNTEALSKKFSIEYDVDSAYIPFLVKHLGVISALEELDGIFGLWIINLSINEIFLARCASTIYIDPNKKSFSSVQTEDNNILLDEGELVVLNFNKEPSFEKVGEFKYNTPYFVVKKKD
jgi:glucosamine 6-phosphate synthetase-like amidotransferase/phosphosugar isomerase protein